MCLCICSSGSSKISSTFPRVHNSIFDPFSFYFASLQQTTHTRSLSISLSLPSFSYTHFHLAFYRVILNRYSVRAFALPCAAVIANRIRISPCIHFVHRSLHTVHVSVRVRKLSVLSVIRMVAVHTRL